MEAQPQAGYSVEAAYTAYHDRLLRYIQTRVNNEWDAENLAQDIWVRVLTSERALQADTLLPYLYTIARNLINDYLRRLYAAKALHDEMACDFYDDAADESMESSIYAGEIACLEQMRVECLPPMRRTIYVMSRYDDMCVADISSELSLSVRTVENHLRLGRKDVRTYLSSIA